MPRINISEVDNTYQSSEEQLYNVVYVPGFSFNEDFKVGDPTIITTAVQFKQIVGDSAVGFPIDQQYPENFSAHAIPESGIMFYAGDSDPSYDYAYQLVSNGIPVAYERVNSATVDSETLYPSTSSRIGFKQGADVPTSVLPTDAEESIDTEIYVRVQEGEQGSDEYILTYYIYRETGWELIRSSNAYSATVTATQTGHEVETVTRYLVSVDLMYDYLSSRFTMTVDNPLLDRNALDIKYLTTGGYPVFEYNDGTTTNAIVKAMQAIANPNGTITDDNLVVGRGDCIVLVDHTCNKERPLSGEGSVIYDLNTASTDIASNYTAMFSPWIVFGGKNMPGSFAYLMSLANAVQTSPNWLAIAGVNRGVIPGASALATNERMTRAIADSYMVNAELVDDTKYSLFINPITAVRPYGLTVWGNRTLATTAAQTEKALYFLNMRSLIAEIKKRCYKAAEQLMFEQNSDVLWINFKAKIIPLLDEMASSYGISGYKIIKEPADSKTQLKSTIKVFPIYAVEDFDITVMLTDEEVTVSEE